MREHETNASNKTHQINTQTPNYTTLYHDSTALFDMLVALMVLSLAAEFNTHGTYQKLLGRPGFTTELSNRTKITANATSAFIIGGLETVVALMASDMYIYAGDESKMIARIGMLGRSLGQDRRILHISSTTNAPPFEKAYNITGSTGGSEFTTVKYCNMSFAHCHRGLEVGQKRYFVGQIDLTVAKPSCKRKSLYLFRYLS